MSREPWGWKVTIIAYGTGPKPTSQMMFDATDHAAEMLGANDFAGVRMAVVTNAPKDQVGS